MRSKVEALFSQRQISQRGRRHFRRPRDKPWEKLRDAATPNRRKIAALCNSACRNCGFCGGPGYAPDLIDKMQTLNAADFAWAILEAEGMGDIYEYDTTWRPYFEAMFMDVFGDGEIRIED